MPDEEMVDPLGWEEMRDIGEPDEILPSPEDVLLSDFGAFEEEYREYKEDESIPELCRPAISAANLFQRPKLPITSYVAGFIYAGSLNLVAGEPKAGKSTLVWYLTNAISLGQSFLGEPSRKANVLYVTEQNEVSFRQETAKIPGFTTNTNLFVLLPESRPLTSWNNQVQFWGEKLKDTKSSVLVVDTFGSFAHFPPGGENDSACVAERIMSLKQLYTLKPNLAIILVHHIRKPSADPRFPVKEFADLRDSRGSSAIVGSVDHCVMLSKAFGQTAVRNIHTEGRFELENNFSIVLTDSGYQEHRVYRAGGFRDYDKAR